MISYIKLLFFMIYTGLYLDYSSYFDEFSAAFFEKLMYPV